MILGGVMTAMLLSSLDQTIVSTAMPRIVQELRGIEHLSWVFTAYMLGSTVTVPVYGKLSDIFGRRKLYILGIAIFLLGSALCGLSQSMNQLILFRGLQGIGGGAMMVNSFAIIGDVFPPAERPKYQGLIGGVFGLSSVAGPLLGGWITDNFSWRWVFYVNLPLGIICILILAAALPKITTMIRDKNIDFIGAALVVTTLVPLLLLLVWGGSTYAWSSLPILISFVIVLISFVLFIRTEKRVSNPILSLQLFQNRVFVSSVTGLFFTSMGMFGCILYIPIFAQGVIGASATHSGLILTPLMLSLVTASAISGQIISRTGKYKALAIGGTIITVLGMFFFSWMTVDTSNAQLITHMVILGAGLGSTMPIYTLAVQSAFGKERLGEVTAGTQLFRSIGATVGTAILGGIMNSRLSSEMEKLSQHPFVQQLHQLNPSEKVDGSIVQRILYPEMQHKIQAGFAKAGVGPQHFNSFVTASKEAFTHSVDMIFLVSGVLMCFALAAVIFLPQIPLRKSGRPVMEDVGIKLEEELGSADKDHQPAKA